MTDLVTLQAQLDKLRTARASGVLRVTEGKRTVEYRTMGDIERAIEGIAADIVRLQALNGCQPRARIVRTFAGKGT